MGDSIAAARVRREINEFQKKDDCQGIILNLEGNDLMKLKGEIDGPPDTPFKTKTYDWKAFCVVKTRDSII